ncbi:MAG: hypothetical protein AB7Q81_24440 [Gammaproteobacteria bacterium]
MPYVDRDGGVIVASYANPQRDAHEFVAEDSSEWIARELAKVKVSRVRDLEREFDRDLNAGFESSALGTPYRYDSEVHNRENLIGAVAAGEDTPYTCDDLQGQPDSKVPRVHTPAQLLIVLRDGKAVKQALIAKLRDKRSMVEAAGTAEAVAMVSWD